MQEFVALAGIIGALAVGVVSPGPSFVMVEAPGRSVGTLRSRSFLLGLTTQVSNPKTAIVYASVFAAFLHGTVSPRFAAVLLCVIFAIEAGWYAIVAAVLSSSRPRRAYLSYKAWVDRAAGVVMAGLGVKLIASAQRP